MAPDDTLSLFDQDGRGDDDGDGGGDGGGDDGEGDGEGDGGGHLPWDGEQVDYSDALLDRGRAYGSYVITSRAIPDVRDGLKPVQRRIIVAMDDLGLRADRKYSKSARTVGTVIGTYHPHGDGAVYDAMVRMAQPWQSNLPLVDGQGNWGNLNNEAPAAAQRYTESRLSPAASAFLTDLRPEVVDYEWNFDETTRVPTVLPVTFPNLLVNGSMGVAWAMACSIPPHNAAEAIDAALAVLDDPEVSLDRLLAVMPGPDLPGGGIVVNPENLRGIYETGRGTVQVQGRVEQLPGQPVLRITELPYQVSARSIVEQAVAGAKEGKITEIYTAELPKNLTDASGVDVRVRAKRGGSPTKLAEELLRHTKLRDTLAFNCTVLVGGVPQTLPLRELLRHFVDFRRQVVTRRLTHERDLLLARLHLLLAERAAADVIDRVVQIIRQAADDQDSRRRLVAELRYLPPGETALRPIDEVQAQHILDMALKRINQLNQLHIDEEIRTRTSRVEEITAILDSADGITRVVRAELKEARKRFARPRRTVIPRDNLILGDAAPSGPSSTPGSSSPGLAGAGGAVQHGEDVWAHVASDGTAWLTPRSDRRPGSAPPRTDGGTPVVAVAGTRTDQPLLLFSEQGRVFRAPLASRAASGSTARQSVVNPDRDDRLVAAFAGPDQELYLLVTAAGQVKRVPASTIAQAPLAGAPCCRVPPGDRIVAVVPHQPDDEILLAKAGGQVLRIETGTKLRPVPTASAGTVAGVRTDPGDAVVGAVAVRAGQQGRLVCLHASGMALAAELSDYPVKGRGTGGVQSVLTDRPARSPAGPLALIAAPDPDEAVTVFTDRGRLISLAGAELPVARRASTSRALLALAPGEAPRGLVAPPPR